MYILFLVEILNVFFFLYFRFSECLRVFSRAECLCSGIAARSATGNALKDHIYYIHTYVYDIYIYIYMYIYYINTVLLLLSNSIIFYFPLCVNIFLPSQTPFLPSIFFKIFSPTFFFSYLFCSKKRSGLLYI